jgi:hypothetical protein
MAITVVRLILHQAIFESVTARRASRRLDCLLDRLAKYLAMA